MIKNKNILLVISVIAGVVVFFVVTVLSQLSTVNQLPIQVTGALLEAIVTAFITFLLLSGQSGAEELKERNMKVFEERLVIYNEFLNLIKRVIEDNKIDMLSSRSKNSDEFLELIFSIEKIQLHSKENTVDTVEESVNELISYFRYDYESDNVDEKAYYQKIKDILDRIVSVFQKELYGDKLKSVKFGSIKLAALNNIKPSIIDSIKFSKKDYSSFTDYENTVLKDFPKGTRDLIKSIHDKVLTMYSDITVRYTPSLISFKKGSLKSKNTVIMAIWPRKKQPLLDFANDVDESDKRSFYRERELLNEYDTHFHVKINSEKDFEFPLIKEFIDRKYKEICID